MNRFCFFIALCLAPAFANASPVGVWRTVDEDTGQPQSLLRLRVQDGVLSALVEQILDPAKAAAICVRCDGERKDKPFLGMVILDGLRQSADDPAFWVGGSVLEIKTGKVYRAQLTVTDAGRKIEMRGFAGAPMFGRTRVWTRAD